jgi:hypothetical protein
MCHLRERSRCLKVDNENEFCRLQHLQIGWLRALKDGPCIDADLTKHVRKVGHIRGTHVPVEEPSTASKDGVIGRPLVDS